MYLNACNLGFRSDGGANNVRVTPKGTKKKKQVESAVPLAPSPLSNESTSQLLHPVSVTIPVGKRHVSCSRPQIVVYMQIH